MVGFVYNGLKQMPVTIKSTNTSATSYTFNSKMSLLVNRHPFSNLPLVSIFYIGICFPVCFGYLVQPFFLAAPGRWLDIGYGLNLVDWRHDHFIYWGGIYLSRIFSETKQRPYTGGTVSVKPETELLEGVAA